MLKKTKLKIAFISALTAMIGVFSISASVAWFGKASVINTNEMGGIDGAVLTSYFHCGKGTEDDPFVITRPKHWENLVWLHNNIEGFYNANNPSQGLDGKGYYFQVGYDLDEDGDLEVFDYKDDGTPNFTPDAPTYSQTLNLTVYSEEGEELIPLGSPQRPFIGELDGSNIKLSGFKVVAVDADNDDFQLEDIGIFGYVGPSGYVHDIYFSDYTINTNGAKIHDETDYELHTPHLRQDSDFPHPCIGSIAGHIMVAESFENVYTNHCTIEGTEGDSESKLNSYSYYGVVEIPTEGGHVGPGSNYSFTLDSSAVYSYMSQNYQNIRNNPLRTRNTEYVDDHPPIDQEFDGNKTVNPFSKGTAYVTSGLYSYNIIGDDPDDYGAGQYTGYNYSLSTLGYQPIEEEGESHVYDLYYKDGSNYIQVPAENKDSLYTGGDRDFETVKNSEFLEKDYLYFDTGKGNWDYFHMANERDENPRYVTFNLKNASTFTESSDIGGLANNPSISNKQVHFFVDGVDRTDLISPAISANDISISTSRISLLTQYRFTVSISGTHTVTVPLQLGIHHIAYVISFNTSSNQFPTAFLSYSTSTSVSSSGTLTIGQADFDMTQNRDLSKPIDITASTGGHAHLNYDAISNFVTDGKTFNPETDLRPYHHEEREIQSTTLYGKDMDGEYEVLKISRGNIEFQFVDYEVPQVDPSTGEYVVDENGNIVYDTYHKWQGVYDAPKRIKMKDDGVTPVDPIFIGDDPILTESGYSAENIDVVGGGFQFSNTFVTIDGEDNRPLTEKLTSADVGTKWYATQHAPNSIVLYLSNVGGLNASDKMGEIKFHYSWTISGLIPGLDFKTMVFKKGGTVAQGGYVYMNNQLAMEDGDFVEQSEGGMNNMIQMVMRRGIVKKCAYAALDKNGNILCGYDSNGNQIANTGTINENQIKTYVLLVGVKNSITLPFVSINTRISRIEFEYIAPAGFGGSFGSVGYRDPYQKLEFTILNFYFLVPQGDKFRVTVSYSGPDSPTGQNKGRYDVTFLYNSTEHDSLEVLFYLYEIEPYEVYCNGTRVAETGNDSYNVVTSNWS